VHLMKVWFIIHSFATNKVFDLFLKLDNAYDKL
jgi:hypothetical protein